MIDMMMDIVMYQSMDVWCTCSCMHAGFVIAVDAFWQADLPDHLSWHSVSTWMKWAGSKWSSSIKLIKFS